MRWLAQVINEVMPDLMMHTMQLANHYGIDLGKQCEERIQFIKARAEKK